MKGPAVSTLRMNQAGKLIGGHTGISRWDTVRVARKGRVSSKLKQAIASAHHEPVHLEFAPEPGTRFLWYHAGIVDGKPVGAWAIAPPDVPYMMEIVEVETFVEELWIPDHVRVY